MANEVRSADLAIHHLISLDKRAWNNSFLFKTNQEMLVVATDLILQGRAEDDLMGAHSRILYIG